MTLAAGEAYYKASALDGKHALRHALRRALRLSDIPRLAEFENLTWLRAQGFAAPRPILAGALWRGGLPRFQFLLTERERDARPLAEVFQGESELRARAVGLLGHDLAHLHARGFVHRDLFARNLLVRSEGEAPPAIVYLDAWRGGPRRGLRGPDYDLACLFLDGATLFRPEEQTLLLTTYREESLRNGRDPGRKWLARVQQGRSAVFRRESRRRPGASPTWEPPRLA